MAFHLWQKEQGNNRHARHDGPTAGSDSDQVIVAILEFAKIHAVTKLCATGKAGKAAVVISAELMDSP